MAADTPDTRVMFLNRGQVTDVTSYRSLAGSWISGLQSQYSLDNTTLAYAYGVGVVAWACSNKKASILSQMPLVVKDGAHQKLEVSPAQQFIENSSRLLYLIQVSYDLFGKFYLRKHYNQYGFPSAVEWLNPLDVYEIIDYSKQKVIGYRHLASNEQLAPSEIISDYLFNPLNAFDGISPFEVAMTNIKAERNIREYGAAFFLNNALPSGFLAVKEASDEEVKLMRKRWREQHAGPRNAHRMEFSNGEMTFTQVTPNPNDLAMKELNDLTARDTCVAFDVNPVLIGLSIASDALSAQSTYDGIKNDHIENVSKSRLMRVCEVLQEKWLAVDFPSGSYILQPDFAELLANTLGTAERSETASINISSGAFGVNDAREYLGREPLEGHVDRDPNWAILSYQAGGLLYNEFRQALGRDVLPQMEGKFIWEVDPRAVAAPSPFSLSLPPGPAAAPSLPVPSAPAMPEKPEVLADESGQGFYVILSLANHPDLIALQKRLRGLFPANVEWSPSNDFHITLIAVPNADDEQVQRISEALKEVKLPELSLTVGSFNFFDNLGRFAMHFRIRRNAALLEFQAMLYELFEEYAISCSAHSTPSSYKPHITMGYAYEKPRPITFASKITVQPTVMQLSREIEDDTFEILAEIGTDGVIEEQPMEEDEEEVPVRAAIDVQIRELEQWRKRIKNTRRHDAVFEIRTLPSEVSTWIQAQLDEHWNPTAIFDAATRWIRGEGDPEPFGATPEEYTEYWRHYDALKADLGVDWITYMRGVTQRTLSAILANPDPDADMGNIFEDGHDDLIAAWTGTTEEPGPMQSIILAGMAAGNESLNRGIAANPEKATRAVEFAIDWEQQAVDALDFSREYGFDLITRIDDTTRAYIKKIVEEWVEKGGTVDELADMLADVLPPAAEFEPVKQDVAERARLIAETESPIVYNEGAFRRWERAGVDEATWQTVRDDRVCKTCRPLHGVTAKISQGWRSPYTRKTYRASAHPKDRCFRRPKI